MPWRPALASTTLRDAVTLRECDAVERVLVHAASVISSRDRKHRTRLVYSVDMRTLVLYLLDGLQHAGIKHAVVALGENAKQIRTAVEAASLQLHIEYVYVPPSLWRNLANSISVARAAFTTDEPFLIVRADHLFDWRLLRKMVRSSLPRGIDALVLVDTKPGTLDWASGAHCSHTCKNGKCSALAKVRHGRGGRVESIGHEVIGFDAVVAIVDCTH